MGFCGRDWFRRMQEEEGRQNKEEEEEEEERRRERLVQSDAGGGGGTTEQGGGGGEEEGDLVLEIKAYKNGIVRLKVTEEKHPEKRFEVPDVLVKDLEDKKLWLQRFVEKDDGSSMVHLGGHDVILQHKPFQVFFLLRSLKL